MVSRYETLYLYLADLCGAARLPVRDLSSKPTDSNPTESGTEHDMSDQACEGEGGEGEGESGFQLALQDSIMQLDLQDMDALSSLNMELSTMLDVTVNRSTNGWSIAIERLRWCHH